MLKMHKMLKSLKVLKMHNMINKLRCYAKDSLDAEGNKKKL